MIEQKGELEKLQEKFKETFENLANKIFEEKTNKFSEQSKTNLAEILIPLKEKISEFRIKLKKLITENQRKDFLSLKRLMDCKN